MPEPQKRTILDAIRERRTAAKEPPKPPEPAAPERRMDTATASCGHAVTYKVTRKPQFERSQRQAVESKPCEDCRQKAHAEKTAAEQAAKAAKQQAAAAKAEERSRQPKFRLPDGSAFALIYDAKRGLWSGMLRVPVEGGEVVYRGEEPAVHYLVRQLGRRCYESGNAVDDERHA